MHQPMSKDGELWLRLGKLKKVKVSVKEGQIIIHKMNETVFKMIKELDLFNERTVQITRTSDKIGMDIRGGVNTPFRVISINKGGDIDRSGQIFENDLILHVNGELIFGKDIHSLKQLIATATDVVQLHVIQTREKKEDMSDSDNDDIVIKNTYDILGLFNESLWVLHSTTQLTLGQLTSYQRASNIPMPHTMSLSFIDEEDTPSLLFQCSPQDNLTEWKEIITTNINIANNIEMEKLKDNFDIANLISFGWVFERVQSSRTATVWVKKFLVLREDEIQLYDKYPKTAEEWQRYDQSYKLMDIFIKTLDSEDNNKTITNLRSYSVIIQTPSNNHTISFEYCSSYEYWLQCIRQTRSLSVIQLKTTSFKGSWNKRFVNFILDLDEGFIVEDHSTKVIYWQRKFSELIDSSDNGHSLLQLKFKMNHKEDIELRDIIGCVHSIEAFMNAKVYLKECS